MNLDAGTVTLISLAITTVGGIVLAFIAFKTAALTRKVDEVKKQTDGITSALVAKTELASHAEGMLAGKAEARTEQKEDATKQPPTPPI